MPAPGTKFKAHAAIRITLIYLAMGGLWILLSDKLVATLIHDPDLLTEVQTIKGWFYVLFTAILLFGLIQRDFAQLEKSQQALEESYDVTLAGWARALDLRDKETENHTQRVLALTLRIGREMAISETELEHVRRGVLLHDIGKMGVPDSILLKPDKLTEDEWRIMRQHPTYAHEWLSPIAFLQRALDIPFCHHEKWDGSGYPRGLRDDQIPLAARIFAVVDVWDALLSDRPYRRSWQEDEVIEYIRSNSGSHFDPNVVQLFLRVVRENNWQNDSKHWSFSI